MISVIIPARNEEELLPATLRALKAQNYPNFEVIVVANGCTDRTPEVATEGGARVFVLGARGLGAARNLGGREARGELLLFLDADTILEQDALAKIAKSFSRRYSCGTIRGEPDSGKFAHKLIYFVKNFIHQAHIHTGSSGVILCWKDHFINVGGFDEALYLRENSHLMKRLLRFGRYHYIGNTPAITSMRRYEARGTGEMVRMWLKVWWLSIVSDIRNETYEDWERRYAEGRQSRAVGRQARKPVF